MSEDIFDLGEKSSMNVWYPKIKDLDIPQPITKSIKLPSQKKLMNFMDSGKISPMFINNLTLLAKSFGSFPIFMRGDGTSAKHDWNKTCYLLDVKNISQHLYALCDYTFMSSMAGELKNEYIFLREFIPLQYAGFTAFGSGFPVNKEIRCFIKNGKKLCHHWYWFEDVFIQSPPKDNFWKSKLASINQLTVTDQKTIDSYLQKICSIFPEYWSVDFAKGSDGKWYLIDMARGEVSYHYEECKVK